MKKLLVVLGVLVLMSSAAFAQGTYFVDYYANNTGPNGTFDQWIRVVNVGLNGTPMTSPVGDICANYYVFDDGILRHPGCSRRRATGRVAGVLRLH